MLVYIFLTSIVLTIYLYVNHCFKYWKRKGVPTTKPHFLFGHTKNVIFQKENIGTSLRDAYFICRKNQQPFCGYYFFTKPILIVCDLNLINKIMVRDFNYFTDRVFYCNDKEKLTLHLGGLEGERWKENRIRFAPLFGTSKIKLLHDRICKCTDTFIDQLHALPQTESIDLEGTIQTVTLDIILCCLFETTNEFISNNRSEIVKYAKAFWNHSTKDSFIRLMLLILPKVVVKMNAKTISEKDVHLFVSKVAEVLQEQGDDEHNFVRILQMAGIQHSDPADVENIAANWWFFFVAGYETLASLILFCLYELALNHTYQEQVVDEVKEAVADSDGEITFAAVGKMRFLDKCIKETLRKYPPATLLRRECTTDYTIPGTTIKLSKGDYVFIPTLGIHNDPTIYPDPEKFLPERFSEENVMQRHSCAWLPFGVGPRMCIGYRFAMLEAKIVISKLLKDFHVSLNSKTDTPSLKMDPQAFLLKPLNGVWVDLQVRSTHG